MTPTTQAGATSADETKTPGQIAFFAIFPEFKQRDWDRLVPVVRAEWEARASRLSAALPPPAVVPESVRRLSEAARPFAACVFNDNGEVTISTGFLTDHDWLRLERAHREIADAPPSGRAAEGGESEVVWHWRKRAEVAEAQLAHQAALKSADGVRYQYREIGEGEGWIDCSREAYEGFARDPHIDTRKIAPTPPASAGDVETERFDARVNAALAAWTEAQRTATVDEHQADTDYGAMMCAVAAADALAEKWSPWTISSENVEALIREFEETHHDRPAGGSAISKLAKRIVTLATAPAAPEPAAGGDGWQPISTAPKDGTSILIGRVGRGVMFAYWYDTQECFCEHHTGRDIWEADKQPTHWRPLPEAPSTPTRADAGAEGRRA